MLLLGLVLIAFSVLAILAGLFATGDSGDASLLGLHIGATSVFLVGLFAGLAILWGVSLTRVGTRRELRVRRDKRRLQELSTKLDQVEAERDQRGDDPDARDDRGDRGADEP